MLFWTRIDIALQLDVRARSSTPGMTARPDTPAACVVITQSSIHVTVALIVPIVKIVATMALIAAQEVEISLVEYDPEQIVVYARRRSERTFHYVDLCTSPLDHEHK